MASFITPPPLKSRVDVPNNTRQWLHFPPIANAWAEWFSKAYTILNNVSQSGTTAERPEHLYIGMPYFDTTIGKPIWSDGDSWVLSDGTAA